MATSSRSTRDRMQLFLSPGEAGGQTLEGGLNEKSMSRTGATAEESQQKPLSFLDPGGDPNSLADQGWGVVAPAGRRGDRLLALIEPLLARRAEDQGREVRVYRVEPEMSAGEAVSWMDRTFVGNELQEDLPGYVAVLGGLTEVSLATQQALSSACNTGRIGFAGDAGYESYIAKLLAREGAGQVAHEMARALYFTAIDGTPATTVGRELLMKPCIADAREQRERGRFPVTDVLELEGKAADAGDALLDAAAVDHPSVLLSCSHGMGAPRAGWSTRDHQQAMQGALCLGEGEHITADGVVEQPFLPGGIWLYFACFGAGTPASSAYHHWLRRLKELGEFGARLDAVLAALPRPGDPPFVAALPQTVLANPNGPLAIIGHLDLAWSYSFQDLDKYEEAERHRRFHGVMRQLVRGSRAGVALRSLLSARELAKTDLQTATDAMVRGEAPGREPIDEDIRLGHRWMLHQDLDGYVLLGDPAARLAISPPLRQPRATAKSARASASTPAPAPATASDIPEHLDVESLEEIVHAMIAGDESPKVLAEKHGVSKKCLREWEDIYTEAGRAALKALLDAAR